MKKRNLFTGFAVATMFLIIATGCKKDNNNNGGGAGISATIGGKAWQSQSATGFHTDGIITLIGVQVTSTDSTAVWLDISDDSQIGQTNPLLNGNNISYDTKTKGYAGNELTNGHGTITLSSWDKSAKKIAGTFSGVLYNNTDDSIKVENGHFNASYIEQP